MSGGSRILLPALLAAWLASPALAGDVVVQPTAGDAFVVKDNTGASERLRVDEATGNVSKDGSLFLHTKGGPTSAFVGADAGAANASCCNAAFGYRALNANSSGYGNSAFGYEALFSNLGLNNSAFGLSALHNNTTGASNSAFGAGALFGNAAAPDKSNNSAFGYNALFANQADGNSAFGALALDANTTGTQNAAFGFDALGANDTGMRNSAFGRSALASNDGSDNSAFGEVALFKNTSGSNNVAFGKAALFEHQTGFGNTAIGFEALDALASGNGNTALGSESLPFLATGLNNIAVGAGAGPDLTSGNDNILIGKLAGAFLTSGDNNIMIGSPVGAGGSISNRIVIGGLEHTYAEIGGIDGANIGSGNLVYINSSGRLGTVTSSRRFKEAIRDMGDASQTLLALRPVTFRYREDQGGDGRTREYGLIAEEVAEVAPDLVIRDEEGEPYSVRYQLLTPMLVNEYQKQQRTIEAQAAAIEELETRVAQLAAQLAAPPAGATP